jgi:hypothetical protein
MRMLPFPQYASLVNKWSIGIPANVFQLKQKHASSKRVRSKGNIVSMCWEQIGACVQAPSKTWTKKACANVTCSFDS